LREREGQSRSQSITIHLAGAGDAVASAAEKETANEPPASKILRVGVQGSPPPEFCR
jgi:hypothetical protein